MHFFDPYTPTGSDLDTPRRCRLRQLVTSAMPKPNAILPRFTVWESVMAGHLKIQSISSLVAIVFCNALVAEENVAALSTIEVRGDVDNGYVAKRANSATKTDTPILDTPMAIQVITRDVLDDQQTLSIQEAVKNVSGVQTPPGVYYDNFLIRGFSTGSDTFRNGLKLNGVIGTEDMAFVDHVDVVKGPASMLYGRIQPGGLVNIVTRKPQDETAASLQQQVGSWGLLRTTADITGPANKDKTLLYRVMGVYDQADNFIDYQHHKNAAGAAYLSWLPSTSFQANLQLEYYDQKVANPGYSAQQIPIIGNRPADVPRHWTQNDPVMWSQWPNTVKRTTAAFDWTYAFNDSWKLTQRFLYYTADEVQTYLLAQAFNARTNLLNRRISYNPVSRDEYSTNLDLTGEFRTGNVGHKLLVGMDWFSYESVFKGYNESGSTLNRVPPLNIFAPVYGNIDVARMQAYFDAAAGNVLSRGKWRDTGFYVQDQIAFGGHWELLLGGRYDIATNDGAKVYGAVSAACYPYCTGALDQGVPTERKFSPRAGLLYKLSNDVSVYGSYSESFGTSISSASSFSGSSLPPQEGVQYELGAKASLMGGRVTTSATLFDLYLRNRPTADPLHPGFVVAVGEVRSRGFEFDVAGQVSNHVSLIGSYTYDHAVITKDNATGASAIEGHRWFGVPLNSASLWAKYDTAPGATAGWAFGAGAYLNGQRQGNNTNTFQLPGYARFDAMLAYRTRAGGKPVSLQLNVQNLFDKTYFENTDGGVYSAYGAPRSVIGSARIEL